MLQANIVAAQEEKQLPGTGTADTLNAILVRDTGIHTRQKDLYDVARSILRLRASTSTNVIGKKPVFSVIPAAGYTLQSRLVATITGNVAFRLSPLARVSTITTSIAYSQNHQFTMPVESSVWSKNNRYNFVGDLRFYKYPQSTYGLGTDSRVADEDPMSYKYIRASEVVLRHISGSFFAGAGFLVDYRWHILEKGSKSGAQSDYSRYGVAAHTSSAGFTINFLYDTRDNSINAYRGCYAAFQYRNSLTEFGSTNNWQSITLDARRYFRFPAASQNILALWSYNWIILNGKPPYLDLPSNSWDAYSSTGRGYIQGRFRGTKMIYGEAEYRFGITNNGLFGAVIFVNAESFSGMPGTALQAIQPGYGTGARIKLNKASRTNISIDYGFGRKGSHGLFINVGELF